MDDEGFGEKATRLAGICQVGVDCAASGRTVQVPEAGGTAQKPNELIDSHLAVAQIDVPK